MARRVPDFPMDTRTLAKVSAGFHVQYGLSLMLMPERNAAVWVGRRAARSPAAKVLAQALGVRDLVMGIAGLGALERDPALARRIFGAMIVTDGVDAIATAMAERIPLTSRIATLTFALGCTAADVAYVASAE
jgi:hypothetical protein